MRRPFERLVLMVDAIEEEDITLGELSERWGEPVGRLMDAIDTTRMLKGEVTYIDIPHEHEYEHGGEG